MSAIVPACAQENLPIGLDKFRWGMSPAEAGPFFSTIGGRISAPDDLGPFDHALYFFAPYRWQTCTLVATLAFDGDKLDHANIYIVEPDTACTQAILSALRYRYGAEVADTAQPYPEPRMWNSQTTDVVFNHRIWLAAKNAKPISEIDRGE